MAKSIDMSGSIIGDWYVVKKLNSRKYMCRCSCGSEREVWASHLSRGLSRSCGCKENLYKIKTYSDSYIGQIFGEWTVLEHIEGRYYTCKCSCGIIRKVNISSLKGGASKSCGHNAGNYQTRRKAPPFRAGDIRRGFS